VSREQLQRELQGYLETMGKSQADVARAMGLASSAVSQWLKGKYAGNSDAIDRKVARLLGLEKNRAETGVAEMGRFVQTSVAEKVFMVCEYCVRHKSMGVVQGAAGMGKTMALLEYANRAPDALYLRCHPGFRRATPLLTALAEKLKLIPPARERITMVGQSWTRLLDSILARLTGASCILIIDEAQYLSVETLEILRTVVDVAEIGLVLAGNDEVYRRVEGERAQFAQLHSRIAILRRIVLGATRDDMAKLAAQFLADDGIDMLVERSRRAGGIRASMKILALARDFAEDEAKASDEPGAKVEVGLKHLQAAEKALNVAGR
jgi:DNA transposition AAA+ family ATPase